MVAANYFKPQEFEVSNWIVDAVILLEEGETTAFCSALTSFLADIPYDSHGSIKTVEATEKHFQYTFYLILRLLGVYCSCMWRKLSQEEEWTVYWRQRIMYIYLSLNWMVRLLKPCSR